MKFYLDQAIILNTLIKETLLLANKGKEAIAAIKKYYQGITSFIIFSLVETRPNIAYAILVMNRFAKNLLYLYRKVVKTIFCYFKATRDVGIMYGEDQRENLIIRGYFDSDCAGNHITKKST